MSASTPASSASAAAPAAPIEDKPLLEVRHRGLLLFAVMLVSICQFLDATIANAAATVALRGEGGLADFVWSFQPADTPRPISYAGIP